MVFDPETFRKEYTEKKVGVKTDGFNVSDFRKNFYGNQPTTIKRGKGKLDDSSELYNLATKSGFQKDADRILAEKGEENKKIFSGGFFSDIFDTLNALQYGVTGTLKGKGFIQGVKNRESWSDKDALGNFGIPGMIGGIALDIATDPLTYIAPYTIFKKIPGAVKGLNVAKNALFGKTVTKAIDAGRTFQTIEGGTDIGKWAARKLKYMFGADPIFKETLERSVKNIGVADNNIVNLVKGVVDLPAEKASQLLTKDKTGRFMRKPLETLKDTLTSDEFSKVKEAYDHLDDLGAQAVEVGLLEKGKWSENVGKYIKNTYDEYELAKSKGVFGFTKPKVSGIKARQAGLTPERMAELGQIDNPSYLLLKSSIDLAHDIENTKLFNKLAKDFASDTWVEGMAKKALPTGQRFFTTSQGEIIGKYKELKDLNIKLKPLFGELKQTFKADKTMLSKISKTEKAIFGLRGIEETEFAKFFQEGGLIKKVIPATRRLGTLPNRLQEIANKIKPFKTFDELDKSKLGIQLEKLELDGVLERAGFSSRENFFKNIKQPFKKTIEKVKEVKAVGNLPKIIKAQKGVENLSDALTGFRNIDKKSIDDSFRFLEKTINDIQLQKEGIKGTIDVLGKSKLGGKYIPEFMKDYLDEIQRVKTPLEKGLNKIVAGFKFGKVILNPATHARNIASNQILNWWKLGLGPWRQDIYLDALKNISKGGKWIDEAKTVGYGLDTFAANELRGLLTGPESNKFLRKTKGLANKIAGIYQGEENFAKLSAFIYKRKAGLGIEDAWKAAESATFNYAQVTPFIRRLRESIFGFPFITFTVKSTPIALETIAKHPGRVSVFGKIKQGIEAQSDITETEKERASEPQWIKDGFFIKLPMKDKYGRSAYFDLTYIIPFGDLVAGNFFERQVARETGLKEGLPEAIASKAPLFQLITELSKNQDFYGDKIFNDSDTTDKQLGDLMRHITKMYAPPLLAEQLPGGHIQAGELKGQRRQKGIIQAAGVTKENAEQQRTLMEELLRNVGAKIQPIDADIQETYMEWEKKKALNTLLKEKGVISEFDISYIPK